MARGWIAIVLAAGLACLSAASASAETRVALVIGNSNYKSVTQLPNPVNDAKAIADELKSAAFDVTLALDIGQTDMRRAIQAFAAKIAGRGDDTVALVYYAGHSVQVDGENFLVPVDARIERQSDIAIASVRLADIMNALAAAPSKMRIVILDACRNNPFATSKETRGLAIVDAPTGSIVAYSTAPGTEATDGAGDHSPYTAAFLEIAKEPKLQIEQLFKRVRLKVHEMTKGQQTPWESSSLTTDFWFFPTDQAAPVRTSSAVATAAPVRQQATRQTVPASAPGGTQAPGGTAATTVAATVPPTTATTSAPQTGYAPSTSYVPPPPAGYGAAPPAPYTGYASGPPPGYQAAPPAGYAAPPPVEYATAAAPPPAVAAMQGMSVDDAYDLVVEEDSVPVYEQFLVLYPYDPRADWVRAALALRVDAIAWRYALVANTPAAYDAYLARYPGGAYVTDAARLRAHPRLRPVDLVFAPRRMVAPPPTLRVALPLLQVRRPPGMPITMPVVLSRPGRFDHGARFTPGSRLPGQELRHDRVLKQNLGNTNFAPSGTQRQNVVNTTVGPKGQQFRQTGPAGLNAVTNQPTGGPHAPQFRPPQHANAGQKPPTGGGCKGRGCRH